VRPDELCSSASGAIDFEDDVQDRIASIKTLADLPIHRETKEELGYEVADSIGESKFLGLTRELIRGGKPELFFVANSPLSWDEIMRSFEKCKDNKKESVEILPFDYNPYHCERLPELDNPSLSGEFKHRFEKILNQIESSGKISIPLLTNLVLWFQYKVNGNV
jgi:hypothetical protein